MASFELVELPDARLAEIGELIRTQDNRITDQPLFAVQQRVRDWGFEDGYEEGWSWVDSDGDGEVEAAQAAELDTRWDSGEGFTQADRFRRVGYRDRWEFVTACFTEQGCKDYLAKDGHNLRSPRIYAYGSYRNDEFRAVRNYLITKGPQA